jgi:hypothetical protein
MSGQTITLELSLDSPHAVLHHRLELFPLLSPRLATDLPHAVVVLPYGISSDGVPTLEPSSQLAQTQK